MSGSGIESPFFTVSSSEPDIVHPSIPIEALLKQVYRAHKAITEGLQEQVNHLTELLSQKKQQARSPCQKCCIIRKAFEKYKGNHHRLVSRQEAKIRLLEAQLSSTRTTSDKKFDDVVRSGSPGNGPENEDIVVRNGAIPSAPTEVEEDCPDVRGDTVAKSLGPVEVASPNLLGDAGDHSVDVPPTRLKGEEREGTNRLSAPSPVAGSPSLIGPVGVLDPGAAVPRRGSGSVPSISCSPTPSDGPAVSTARRVTEKKLPRVTPKRRAPQKGSISPGKKQRKLWDGRCFLSINRHTPLSSKTKRIQAQEVKTEPGNKEQTDGKLHTEETAHEDDATPFKYCHSPVRKRGARQQLPAHDCKECRDFYRATSGDELMRKCSRHRAAHAPPATPEYFWEMDFPDTQECRRRGYVKQTQGVPDVEGLLLEQG